MTKVAHRNDAHEDHYPSRVLAEPRLIERSDRIIHGKAASGPLTADELRFYEDNGFLSYDAFFDAHELAPVIEELNRLRASDIVKHAPEAIIEPDSGALRSVFAIHKRNAVFRGLCRHPRLVSIARQLLGSEVYMHQSRINYKSGFHGKEFYWHSDFETWHVEDGIPAMRLVSCNISLTPNTEFNGPLMAIPGSHRQFLACVGETPEDNYKSSLQRQEFGVPDEDNLARLVDEGGIVSFKGGVGSVTFFECNLMHGSNSNITPLPRSNIFIVFNSVENTPVAPYCGLAPRPGFLAERDDFTPIRPSEG